MSTSDKRNACGCGCVTSAVSESRERRARRPEPQSWILQKSFVGVVIVLVCYAYYVYIGTFCVPMIRGDEGALGGRRLGITLLAVYCFLGFMFWWTYMKIILTGPGFASDLVTKSPRPTARNRTPPNQTYSHVQGQTQTWQTDSAIGTPYESMSQAGSVQDLSQPQHPTTQPIPIPIPAPTSALGEEKREHVRRESGEHDHKRPPSKLRQKSKSTPKGIQGPDNESQQDANTGDLDAFAPVAAAKTAQSPQAPPSTQQLERLVQGGGLQPPRTNMNFIRKADSPNANSQDLPPPLLSRRPPTTPVLLPEYRYCHKEGFIKPLRAHHCRACGTCILKYDHHCPWIGQCVGAFNHKFFVNFLFWSSTYTLYLFVTLLVPIAQQSGNDAFNLNGQQVAIIVLAGLFAFFTILLVGSHVRLILVNTSTVESLGTQRMKDRERATLKQLVAWHQFGEKRRIKKRWDEEWGQIGTEGNLWWLGTSRANWEAVMGHHFYEWILPVGRSDTDGLHYPRNPRFDADGRWRRRAEWPAELR